VSWVGRGRALRDDRVQGQRALRDDAISKHLCFWESKTLFSGRAKDLGNGPGEGKKSDFSTHWERDC